MANVKGPRNDIAARQRAADKNRKEASERQPAITSEVAVIQ